jgi:hypothetical protein
MPAYTGVTLNIARLLSVGCTMSALAAFYVFTLESQTGYVVFGLSLAIAALGQLFLSQAANPEPSSWAGVVQLCFYAGCGGLVVFWLMHAT